MNRVRNLFNNFMSSERYSRFTLQTEQDGERRVQMKISEDGIDGDAEGGVGGSPTFRPAPRRETKKSLCFLLLATLVIFLIGYMLAFLIHGKTKAAPKCESEVVVLTKTTSTLLPHEPQSHLTWTDITDLLETKLTSTAFDQTLREFDVPLRTAGSDGDTRLGNKIVQKFKELEMDPWTDTHHVRLQTPDKDKPNRVIFGSNNFRPGGFLAYSGNGSAQGKLVYANYGRPEDFAVLSKNKIDVKNSVLIVRSGNISFAQKVANAEERGAVAVLIYPDSQDYKYASTEIYGHVHLGSGDPYTPGFPSFNHTQFPPTKSAGLPNIPAQSINSQMAKTILQSIGGPIPGGDTGFVGGDTTLSYALGGVENITVEVNNALVFKEIHNVFGVIKGFVDPDRYVVLGAQRDAWGPGYARATVGTATLIELAKAIRDMVEKDEFRPRRSIVFASWSAGEYGSVGATEWLEAYTSSLDKSVLTYISLDGIVQGIGSFRASASPLLQNILDSAMKSVKSPTGEKSVHDMKSTNLMHPMSMDDPAYPFLASSGIPSISFQFTSQPTDEYEYYNTLLDSKDHLDYGTSHKTSSVVALAAQLAGHMALRLVHSHLLPFEVTGYKRLLNRKVYQVNNHVSEVVKSGQLQDVSTKWLFRAQSSFQRAADALDKDIRNTDLSDAEACRLLNDRIMRIEHSLLSPYVSPLETPFRHLLFGKGPHTLAAIAEMTDMNQLHTELALATWNIQSCANAMVGDLWEIDNEI